METERGKPEGAADRPRLRPVEAFPVEVEGRRLILMRDPAGVSDAQVLLSADAFFIAAQFTGGNDLREIQTAYVRRFGDILPSERIRDIAARLDEALLLEGERFEAHFADLKAAFAARPARPAALAGKAYEDEPEALRARLDGCFEGGQGPPAREEGRAGPKALIAPHLDLERGAEGYGAAWGPAARGAAPDAVVILGTAHAGFHPGLFIATRKAYETPLGTSPCDGALVEALADARGEDLFAEEFAHANEHSVEFQVLFAQHCFGPEIPVLPLLVCSFHEFVVAGRSPADDERVRGFVDALRGAVAALGRRVLVVASADLAHVGPKFGDPQAADGAVLGGVRASDTELLKRAGALDAEGVFERIARSQDRTRVCGFPSIYTLLKLVEGEPLRGTLRTYGHAPDSTGSAVTYAGMTFEEDACPRT